MRLIDADELLKKLIATDDYEIDGDTYWDYVVYEEDIKKAKTVDAVPVVRCEDCIYCSTLFMVCTYNGRCEPVNADDFCSMGERK